MEILQLQPKYSLTFIAYLKNLLYTRIKSDILKNRNSDMFKYIYDTYKISINDILKALSENIITNKVINDWSIEIDRNVRIKNSVKLITIADLIDFGNRSVKGLKIFSNNTKYLKINFRRLYSLYLIACKGDN